MKYCFLLKRLEAYIDAKEVKLWNIKSGVSLGYDPDLGEDIKLFDNEKEALDELKKYSSILYNSDDEILGNTPKYWHIVEYGVEELRIDEEDLKEYCQYYDITEEELFSLDHSSELYELDSGSGFATTELKLIVRESEVLNMKVSCDNIQEVRKIVREMETYLDLIDKEDDAHFCMTDNEDNVISISEAHEELARLTRLHYHTEEMSVANLSESKKYDLEQQFEREERFLKETHTTSLWYANRSLLKDVVKTESDIGGVMIGNRYGVTVWRNGYGDGITRVGIADKHPLFMEYIGMFGIVNGGIYSYDCDDFRSKDPDYPLPDGRYFVYNYDGMVALEPIELYKTKELDNQNEVGDESSPDKNKGYNLS